MLYVFPTAQSSPPPHSMAKAIVAAIAITQFALGFKDRGIGVGMGRAEQAFSKRQLPECFLIWGRTEELYSAATQRFVTLVNHGFRETLSAFSSNSWTPTLPACRETFSNEWSRAVCGSNQRFANCSAR